MSEYVYKIGDDFECADKEYVALNTSKGQQITVALTVSGVPFKGHFDKSRISFAYDGEYKDSVQKIIDKFTSDGYADQRNEIEEHKDDNCLYCLPAVAKLLRMTEGTLRCRPTDIQLAVCKRYVDNWYCDTYTIQHELKYVWLKVQDKKSHNSKFQNNGIAINSWLVGMMKCSNCGYAMHINHSTGKRGQKYRYFFDYGRYTSDGYVFTLNEECEDKQINQGELNLFDAINFAMFDGVIYAPYLFSSNTYRNYLDRYLLDHCTLPVVRIGIEKEHFIPVWYDDKTEFAELVHHMITAHGCKKICCLTGPEEFEVSHNRLAGYRQAMEESGLSYDESDMIFGDFWVCSGQNLAAEIAEGKREKPDAVVCANDIMAISLCDALIEKGYAVPDDIRITGYDGHTEAELHTPPITTYQNSSKYLGAKSMCRLLKEITGRENIVCSEEHGVLLARESCGCQSHQQNTSVEKFDLIQYEIDYMDYSLSAVMLGADNLNSFIGNLFSQTYRFIDMKHKENYNFYLCLCKDWDDTSFGDGERKYRTTGYSDTMIFFSSEYGRVEFPLQKLLPDFTKREKPSVYLFTAVHFKERCFGYACYEIEGDHRQYPMNYLRFCREVNNGLQSLCTQNELKRLAYHKYVFQSRDELTGLFLLENSTSIWSEIIETAELYSKIIYIVPILIEGLGSAEESGGGDVRDKLLVDIAELLNKGCRSSEKLLRVNDSGFVIIGTSETLENRYKLLDERITKLFQQYHQQKGNPYFLRLRHECLTMPYMDICSFDEAVDKINAVLSTLAAERSALDNHYGELIELRKEFFSNPEVAWSIELCSKRLNVSASYFQRIYVQTFGVNCMKEIKQLRLNKAKRLLLTTDATLTDIAQQCGYDYFNFMKMFKKEMGMTLSQFRKG